MDFSDGKKSAEIDEISKTMGKTLTDVDEEYDEIDHIEEIKEDDLEP